ncbi:DUF4115 domain-containing protein [Undibacterium cyanobacteriorum]|uniref:DUF4115 domain-containing protein n=1 Tax=Undibacterium cyanobacteriorum TaxID=3073561 RepID=A0ABY9RN26_9BURK|nr:RodZ domain-containing protein [Undibacterium sp. 20NA77.5]WMW82288.1 DUF4115 domain-containing protein [Undibacterium sp. 20NA77.5]
MSDNSQEQMGQEFEPSSLPKFDSMSVGKRLAYFREQRGWTVQYVAEQLKLSQSQIVSLESDQFDKLPKLVIVRGFVRAYSKLLRIDAAELMSLMPQDADAVALETSLRPALATPFIEPRMSLTGSQENNKRYVVGILVLLILALLTLVIQRTDFGQQLVAKLIGSESKGVSTVSVPVSPDLTQAAAGSAPLAVQSASMVQVNSVASATQDATASTASLPVVSSGTSAAIENVASKVVDEAPKTSSVVPEQTSAAQTNSTNDKLVLRFKHDSWLFVKANGGAVLTSRMVRAGAEESFDVKQGLFVKIGNAADVEAILRGNPLPVVTERDSKVANLNVK